MAEARLDRESSVRQPRRGLARDLHGARRSLLAPGMQRFGLDPRERRREIVNRPRSWHERRDRTRRRRFASTRTHELRFERSRSPGQTRPECQTPALLPATWAFPRARRVDSGRAALPLSFRAGARTSCDITTCSRPSRRKPDRAGDCSGMSSCGGHPRLPRTVRDGFSARRCLRSGASSPGENARPSGCSAWDYFGEITRSRLPPSASAAGTKFFSMSRRPAPASKKNKYTPRQHLQEKHP